VPISGDQQLDRGQRGFGLPSDTCCVGDGGPSPVEATMISNGSGPVSGYAAQAVPVGYDGPVGTGREQV
jgi:hypothetical protein